MSRSKNIIVAVTGASGSVYARQLLDSLVASEEVARIGLVVSRRGAEVAAWEGVDLGEPASAKLECFDNDDMFSSPASGSARWDAMVVVPCSVGCVGRIASGVSTDLIARAADVMLKEGRTLIVVPRETPLNLIHLRNLTTLAEAGAVVMPASPSFYSHPEDIAALCATVTDRILARLGVAAPHFEWGERDGK
jgi:4-hydroxy-3-polyprenylbenzoate decarboxylase